LLCYFSRLDAALDTFAKLRGHYHTLTEIQPRIDLASKPDGAERTRP